MSISTSTLISELRVAAGNLDSSELPDDDALLLLNRAFWEIQNKFKFREMETESTLATVASQAYVAVPADFESLQIIGVVDPDTDENIKLTRMSLQQYEEWKNANTELEAIPTHYMRRGAQILFYPTPDQIYSIDVYHRTRLQDLDNAPVSDPTIPQEWHEIILMGGLYRQYMRTGDFDRGRAAKSEYLSLIGSTVPVETKEQIDSDKANIEVPGRTSYRI